MMALFTAAVVLGTSCRLVVRHPILDLSAFKDRGFAVTGFVFSASAVLAVLATDALLLIAPIPSISKTIDIVAARDMIAFGGLALGSAPVLATSTIACAAALFGMAREAVGGFGFPVSPSRVVDQQGTLHAQSAVLAYADVFLLTGCAALLFIPSALMLSGARPRPSGGGH